MTQLDACQAQPLVGDYFVPAYPPFRAWKPDYNPALMTALQQPRPESPLGLYVHIPFCQKKCDYCHSLSFTGQPPHVANDYVETVVDELELYAATPGVAGRRLKFVYFGGGTPSLLSCEQARELIGGLKQTLPWGGVEEVTFECAPRSVRMTFVEALLDLGITRWSMGVQSFDDDLLALNGRAQNAAEALQAYGILREAGCGDINLDLMCGLPGETQPSWDETVRRAIELNPDSVTIYQTEIAPGSATYRNLTAGLAVPALISWNDKRRRLEQGFAELERSGYTVTSAYAAVKDPARQINRYQEHLWHGGDMLGLGTSAFGYFQGVHYQNESAMDAYCKSVQCLTLPLRRAFSLSQRDQMLREYILQLKLGIIEPSAFKDRFGIDITNDLKEPLDALVSQGYLKVENDTVRATNRGLLQVDWLSPSFFDLPFRQNTK